MVLGAVLLFVVAGVFGGRSGPSDAELWADTGKIMSTCDSQYNSRIQSSEWANCVNRLGGAYVEGVKKGIGH
jgi:hypothetical protein